MTVETAEFLRCAIASHYSEAAKDRWRTLFEQSPPDWTNLVNYSNNQGLSPLLYEVVKKIGTPLIPREILGQLSKSYYETAGHNLLVLQEIRAVLDSFSENDIQALLLKGAALILDVYDEPAQRPMIDIDFLIRFQDLQNAKGILRDRHYGELKPHPFGDDSGLVWNEEILVHNREKRPVIELHWHLLDNPHYASRLETDWLMARSRNLEGQESTAKTLGIEDQFIHLCCHNFYHHMGEYTRSLVDLAFFVSKYNQRISWDEIVRQAEEYDLKLAVGSAIALLSTDWFVSFPPVVMERAASWKPSRYERFSIWCQRSEFRRALRTFVALPGGQHKLLYLKGQLFPDRDYLKWRYDLADDSSVVRGYIRRYSSGIRSAGRAVTRGFRQ